ncbi:DUF5602 domain-containing protein [Cesiribacter sp. SM1]|uniref:DUF5602 domain-containing protein n=1 Tax=Cesiribacter sp. SM1 TaxID=2861196 RepID=UPI001CD2CFAF|nr:DUF5602 domain-containing protein [Cesiribacter sp. SM1]
MKKSLKKSLVVLMATVLTLSACEKDGATPAMSGTYQGKKTSVGDGKAWAWITVEKGVPAAVGITLDSKAFNSFSEGMHTQHDGPPTEYVLELPKQKSLTPFDHISFDWAAHGHAPEGVYTVPHFDVHFYMSTQAERQAILPDDPKSEIFPAPAYMPAQHVPIPGSVPFMGKHWVDVTSPELNGGPFTTTFIYGSYNGKVSFYEPMINYSWLQTKPTITKDIPQPEAYSTAGYYPTRYKISYDSSKDEYHIVLEDMISRQETPLEAQ